MNLRTLAVLLPLLAVRPATATVVAGLDREALVRGAEAIVAGVVTAVEAQPGPPGGPEILTRIEIEVWQAYKAPAGGTPPRLALLQTGGSLDGRTLHIHGQARFAVGERVLVFVERLADGRLVPHGMAQGKFTLVERDGRTVAVRDVRDLAFAHREADGRLVLGPAGPAVPVELDLAQLEALIARFAAPALQAPVAEPPRHVR